ncbi:WD40/YVTN/BNR-like repeat-containing protein [Halobacterium rubrum]|uniref:WD40/YVTN/BNR-like repeat-containing protein n=1 Tax=Halobacterium TaxID=2239 RepID=UPI001F17D415|nr:MULTISPECIES: WD40 repeat domain-containing protein [Halobacterium]MDH5019513.1 WD40 repeat domain-containing protein [Halobacterium rubrum]
MLLVGSDDGVHAATGVPDAGPVDATHVLDAGQAMRVETFDAVDGVFAATTNGLYHSGDGTEWTDLGVPDGAVYCVGADDGRLYAGTRPARLFAAAIPADHIEEGLAWRELDAFDALADREAWGIDRHDGVSQVRDVRSPAGASGRLVVGVEVGGVFVSEDGGETWTDRRVTGFDAPHLDDVHHVEVESPDTWVAATGSGLCRTTDAGRSWARLDNGHRQTYFRESLAHDGRIYAGGSPSPPGGWRDDRDHALFESTGGESLTAVESPVPEEVAVGWTVVDGDVYAVTNRGTLIRRSVDGWRRTGTVPHAESVHGRTQPLAWVKR